ncbi:MAG: HD-GYP domain-containing protein [Tissierellia bacterium]|nr:HD-GYP domain-containing protein [Tissierellia bacterium]
MIKKSTNELKPGMVLSEDVDSLRSGAILVSKNTVLNKKIIKRIHNYGIRYVYIYSEDNMPQEISNNSLEIKYEILSDKMENVFADIKIGKKIILTEINEEVNELVDEVLKNDNILGIIRELEEKDDYTFNHSLNVSMLATMLGKWLGYSMKQIKQLALTGLFHDIGKLKVPDNIINKPGELTELEFGKIKEHPIYGYNILKETVGISNNISLGVLQHHEREDGSGYPLGLKGNEIHEYAKIIAVCDTYDAITSNRVYKPKSSPFFAAEILEEKSFTVLEPRITRIFLDKIAGFYVGCTVLLSNGQEGDIVYIHPQAPTKAIVKIKNEFINFLEPQNISIVDIIK